MEVQVPLSVRDIKGKFEKLLPPDSPNCLSSQRRRRTPFSTIDPSPNEIAPSLEDAPKESTFLAKLQNKINCESTDGVWSKRPNNNNSPLSHTDENKEPFDNEVRVESRNRSLSVGSLLGVGFVNNETKPQLNSQTLVSRNQSFNDAHHKVKVKRNDEMPFPNYINNNNNFSSFTEKQKLVESIVMNIKNSRNLNKESGSTSPSKHMTSATKENNVTSKFEKDLRNALEKGVRILGAKNTKEKCSLNDRQVTNTEWAHKSKCESDDHFKSLFVNQRRSFSKINAMLGEYIYPIKDKKKKSCKPGNMEEDKEHIDKDTIISNQLANHNSNHCLLVESNVNEINYDAGSLYETMRPMTQPEAVNSPLPPPRKRSPKKKGKAPEPPLTLDTIITNEDSYNSSAIDELKERNASCQSLKNNSWIEYEDPKTTEADTTDGTYTHVGRLDQSETYDEDILKRRRAMSEATPPKKPPRTFAHDIYQCYKQETMEQARSTCELSKKLTPEEIESLYTKPLKNNKPKKPQAITPTPGENKITLPKPTIAPKPIDIMARARQRYSVVEPLSPSSKEFADHRLAVKRNSSFRFSFKKSKKSAISHPLRPVAAKDDSPVGRKFKQVARQWQYKKNDRSLNDKQVRFRPRVNNKEMLHKDDDDDEERIYAIPTYEKITTNQQQPELHYMCSPLFVDNRVDNNINISQRERSPTERGQVSDSEDSANPKEPERNFQRITRGRFGLMDGLKEEWRQSYRFVQKRLKKGLPTSARKL